MEFKDEELTVGDVIEEYVDSDSVGRGVIPIGI